MSNTKEFLYGSVGGLVGQLTCHPFDTAKTLRQSKLLENSNYSLVQDIRTRGSLILWQGLPSPLVSVMVEKTLLFGSYDWFRHKLLDQAGLSGGSVDLSAGVSAGLLTTLTVTPFERIKILAQTDQQSRGSQMAVRRLVNQGRLVSSLYQGWSMTLLREVPGYGLYFWTYQQVKNRCADKDGRLAPKYAFMAGAMSGITAWLVIYPSDPIKTFVQKQDNGQRVSPRMAIREIWRQSGIRGFYHGYSWGLLRAGILHGGVFLGYEGIKRTLEKPLNNRYIHTGK